MASRLAATPPEAHPEIARSVAGALTAAVFVSFEDTFFTGADLIDTLERAERFAAQRPLLRRRAEQVIDELMKQHGRAGNRVVLGDPPSSASATSSTWCAGFDDLTATGGRGFWAVVIPGVVHRRQPLFNEKPARWVFSIRARPCR